MTAQQEQEMHELAEQLEAFTCGTGWSAMRYMVIGDLMNKLAEYCAVSVPLCPTCIFFQPETEHIMPHCKFLNVATPKNFGCVEHRARFIQHG